MQKEFIVAIELGSSKITGIAGRHNLDGSFTILSVVKETPNSCIRKGVVYNIDKTVMAITNIVTKLEKNLKTKIAHVYVGVGGQSIRSVKNSIVKQLEPDTIVSQDMINELMDINRNMSYPDQEILDAITQEYKVGNQYQIDPAGIQCTRLEGNFQNILWRKTFYSNLNKCFDNAQIAIAEMYLAPLALADAVLTENERRSGCMLVDLGAETTTVSVYYKNILRHLAVIPLGGQNVTKDIATLQLDETDAENMKLKYGNAYCDSSEIDNNTVLSLDAERTIGSRKFFEIVEARVAEIVANAWYQVSSEYADKLLGGIILTGGGANMKNIDKAFANHTRIEKIRIAKFVNATVNSKNPEITAHDATMNTVLGLMMKGNMNCAGEELGGDLFGTDQKATTSTLHEMPRDPKDTAGTGIVQTEAEKKKAEEEARKRKEAEEEAARIAAEEERKRIAEEKRKNSVIGKAGSRFKDFFKKIITEEE